MTLVLETSLSGTNNPFPVIGDTGGECPYFRSLYCRTERERDPKFKRKCMECYRTDYEESCLFYFINVMGKMMLWEDLTL